VSAYRIVLSGVVLVALCRCASVPDVDYSYYPSQLHLTATVSQTVDCTKDGSSLIIVNTPAVNPNYSADLSRGPYHVRIRAIEGAFGPFADSDANFSFSDDGRLKSINQTTTGEGETIIKSFVTLATTAAAFGALDKDKNATKLPECDVVANWGQGKPVSLSYGTELDFPGALRRPPFSSRPGHPAKPPYLVPIPATDNSKKLYGELDVHNRLPNFYVSMGEQSDAGTRALNEPVSPDESDGDFVKLTLQRAASVETKVTAGGTTIWRGLVAIPDGTNYDLPIPMAALFGMQKFSLTLNDAGAVTAVDYGKNTGAAGAANAANAVAAAVTPETAAAKAADLKAQADVIAQGQRLARCESNPTGCQ
jgi:hypothetical protein